MLRLLSLRKHFCAAVKQTRYRFQHAYHIVPHPEKAHKGGEDAVYVSDNVLLVADGVGGWAESNIDPALYSKRLAKIVEELVQKDALKYIQNPKALIKEAVELNKETGSTTVCLMTLHPQSGIMKAYYLGDSVYALINRSESKIRVAQDQQYSFNFPVQVGTNGQNPENGILHEYTPEQISKDETIVVATDGIWDNLQHYMISEILAYDDLQKSANDIALYASYCGKRVNYESPFYLKAKKMNIEYPMQGKLDDCSVILAKIIKEQL